MASEGLEDEEWDADFLEELVQAEELALSTQRPNYHHSRSPPPPPPPQRPSTSHSPPRELSQRPPETFHVEESTISFQNFAAPVNHFAKEQEIDRLKKELGRVSKQLNRLEQECSELRKDKNKKEECLKGIHSRVEADDAETCHAMDTDLHQHVSNPMQQGISRTFQNTNQTNEPLSTWTKSCNTVGVQTDEVIEQNNCCSEKLLGLWNLSDHILGKSLVGKLLTTCEKDFHVLFGYLNLSSSDKRNMRSAQFDSGLPLSDQLHRIKPIETIKVSQFYSQLTKIGDETSSLEDLFEALVDLCTLKNVDIVYRSLHVLHMILVNSFSMEKKFQRRENIMAEEPSSGNNSCQEDGYECPANETLYSANVTEMLNKHNIQHRLKVSNVTLSSPGDHRCSAASISEVYCVYLFERTCQIAIKNKEEEIRREALSIMNLILMRQNAHFHRDKFFGEQFFQSLSQLLKKDAGFCVQELAVHTLYLICNCPKVMATLCCGFGDEAEYENSDGMNENRNTAFQVSSEILIGLGHCVAFSGSATAEEMKLRRNAVLFLAFLGSSGKSGMDILLNYRLPKGTNFLDIIVQSLTADLDMKIPLSDVVREQSLLIREALILLNRLVSHKNYSISVLQILTRTSEMASMTVDVANRLSHQPKLWKEKITVDQIRESEVMDLALVFKKRIFTFLGDRIP